jgi:hypothetical protein
MRISTLALFIALAAAPLAAQEAWLIPFAAGFSPDVGGFNTAFADAGLPRTATRQYGWGIELRSYVAGLLIGPLYFRTWDDAESNDYQLRADATGILGAVGLRIAPFSFLTIVPQLGVGGVNQSFTIREKSGATPLPDLLADPGRTVTISPGMKLAGLAALELGASFATDAGRYGLALRGGYLYSPSRLDWRLSNGAPLTGTPASRIAGPFISAGILLMPAPSVE